MHKDKYGSAFGVAQMVGSGTRGVLAVLADDPANSIISTIGNDGKWAYKMSKRSMKRIER